MSCCCRDGKLAVVQGDTLDVTVFIENPEQFIIEKVEFVCKSLGLREELFPVNEEDSLWGFTIEAENTKNLRVGNFSFDVTATTDGGEVYTVIHNWNIEVRHKVNK